MRLFIASRIGSEAAHRIQEVVQAIRGRTGRASWVAPDAYHLTYAFLGEQPEDVVESLASRLSDQLPASGPVNVTLSGGGFFPTEKRARVAWIGIEGVARLEEIAVSVRRSLDKTGVSYDAKPFRPHLTIARIRGRWSRSDIDLCRRGIDGLGRITVVVERVVLYRSELSSGGAKHHEMAAISLSR